MLAGRPESGSLPRAGRMRRAAVCRQRRLHQKNARQDSAGQPLFFDAALVSSQRTLRFMNRVTCRLLISLSSAVTLFFFSNSLLRKDSF